MTRCRELKYGVHGPDVAHAHRQHGGDRLHGLMLCVRDYRAYLKLEHTFKCIRVNAGTPKMREVGIFKDIDGQIWWDN